MDEGHGSGNSSQVLGGDLEYFLVYRTEPRPQASESGEGAVKSVFEDFAQRHHDLGAGNAQHPILQRRMLFGGVQVAFERFRIDHPDIGSAILEHGTGSAIHPQRTVFGVENLNPEERWRLQESAGGLRPLDYT